MKVAIYHNPSSFSTRWIEYCKSNKIDYKLVNPYASDIIGQLKDCDAFLWHISQIDYRDMLFGKQLLYSVKQMGLKVFPDFNTSWHFDDKVGQKYLLEAMGAPFVPSYVFYTRGEALKWIKQVSFPKVFKLRGGAGSKNVFLVKDKKKAFRLVKRAFSKGFRQTNVIREIKERARKRGATKFKYFIVLTRAVASWVLPVNNNMKTFESMHGREKGYVYFQDFISNNTFDIRVVVTGNKALAIKRMVRKDDFRASGSGSIIYEKNQIDERCIQISFEINRKLQTQSIAFDFIFDENNKPLIVEISYGYMYSGYDACPGYWDENVNWHEGSFNPQNWQIENLISK
ncbi:MAG: hypothetical protein K8R67_09255 [Desulfobacteraceae bacterium]|nr:hypothetical protein [Desulfobacteraceae bacterium]